MDSRFWLLVDLMDSKNFANHAQKQIGKHVFTIQPCKLTSTEARLVEKMRAKAQEAARKEYVMPARTPSTSSCILPSSHISDCDLNCRYAARYEQLVVWAMLNDLSLRAKLSTAVEDCIHYQRIYVRVCECISIVLCIYSLYHIRVRHTG